MKKELRPYQAEAVQTLKKRLKSVTHPLLVTASVGAGKSLIIASILQWLEENSNYKVLCLTLNSTLIQQNAQTYIDQGGKCGIYCSGLNSKDTENQIIFASPQSVVSDLRDDGAISQKHFNLVVVDEAHNISPHDRNTMFQRIINHYGILAQTYGHSYRVIGLTGTPYRGKGNSIVGPDQFFKEEICNISTSWLISQGYLTKPVFGLTEAQGYDFSKIRVNSMGKFSGSELQAVIDSNARLTGQIMSELQEVMKTRKGAFIFSSTRKHCDECAKSLPEGEWAIITGETPHEERKRILASAKMATIRYLISVNCLNVGVDVPNFDVCAWLRPTESLVLYTQGIGRVLRLHPDKSRAIILDYAGNLQRHGDIDDPIINEALQPKEENEKDYIIPCLCCAEKGITTLVTLHTRRCFGVDGNGARCDNYFEWKDCMSCSARNDTTARQCRCCGHELIDPNAKLSLKPAVEPKVLFDVLQARYWLTDQHGYPCWNSMYQTKQGINIYESFGIKDDRMKNLFYGIFLKAHCKSSSSYYPILQSLQHLRKMLESGDIRTPHTIHCKFTNNRYQITKREFHEETSVIKRLIDGKLLPQTTMPTTPSSTT